SAFAQAPAPPAPAPAKVPPPPDVHDPMLVGVTPATRNIGSWEEALDHVRARSTDLRTAYDEVLHAEALSRIALASALTTINGTVVATHNFVTRDIKSVDVNLNP